MNSMSKLLLGMSVGKYFARDAVRNYRCEATSQEVQLLLKNYFRSTRLPLSEVGFRKFSQFEEDGILLYIFARIGEGGRRVVEICAGNGRECMATNLILNHGWQALLVDGNSKNVKVGQQFFKLHADSVVPPTFIQAWVTAENINGVVGEHGYAGDIDLLSLDVDGNDYWLWRALEVARPRVCVIETNSALPTDRAITSPYSPDFAMAKQPPGFHSASLAAVTKLAKAKGYRLIGTHRYGFNAFFMRNDVGAEDFPEITVAQAHDNPFVRSSQATKWPNRQHYAWQAV